MNKRFFVFSLVFITFFSLLSSPISYAAAPTYGYDLFPDATMFTTNNDHRYILGYENNYHFYPVNALKDLDSRFTAAGSNQIECLFNWNIFQGGKSIATKANYPQKCLLPMHYRIKLIAPVNAGTNVMKELDEAFGVPTTSNPNPAINFTLINTIVTRNKNAIATTLGIDLSQVETLFDGKVVTVENEPELEYPTYLNLPAPSNRNLGELGILAKLIFKDSYVVAPNLMDDARHTGIVVTRLSEMRSAIDQIAKQAHTQKLANQTDAVDLLGPDNFGLHPYNADLGFSFNSTLRIYNLPVATDKSSIMSMLMEIAKYKLNGKFVDSTGNVITYAKPDSIDTVPVLPYPHTLPIIRMMITEIDYGVSGWKAWYPNSYLTLASLISTLVNEGKGYFPVKDGSTYFAFEPGILGIYYSVGAEDLRDTTKTYTDIPGGAASSQSTSSEGCPIWVDNAIYQRGEWRGFYRVKKVDTDNIWPPETCKTIFNPVISGSSLGTMFFNDVAPNLIKFSNRNFPTSTPTVDPCSGCVDGGQCPNVCSNPGM